MEVFVPGRLCVLGEHTDWAAEYQNLTPTLCNGHTLVCATNEGLYARVTSTPTSQHIHFYSTNSTEEINRPYDREVFLQEAQRGGYLSYIYGTIVAVLDNPKFQESLFHSKGITIYNYQTTLPMKKGLSSSAAICVLIVKSFQVNYAIDWNLEEIMELAYLGEMNTPSRCGRMDQCVVMGSNAIGLMTFQPQKASLQLIQCKASLYFLVIDLKSFKDTVTILRDLNACFPHAQNETQALMHRYVYDIERIAEQAKVAIETGDVKSLGECMNQAQVSFDQCAMPNCQSQLVSPRLHMLMNDSVLRERVLAIKGVGSQGDGSAQLLVRTAADQESVLQYIVDTYHMEGFPLTIPGSDDL